jgi:hypothetical protein
MAPRLGAMATRGAPPVRRSARTHSVPFFEGHVGSNPHDHSALPQRREWDVPRFARKPREPPSRGASRTTRPTLGPNPLCALLRRSRGFEPT